MTETPRRRRGPKKGEGAAIVYETIRRRILLLQLPPGANLSEATLVEELGVSRTPVREALTRLAAEGLIDVLPNQGARVASADLESTSALLEAFELAQRAVTRWAAIKHSDRQMEEIRARGDDFKKAAAALQFEEMGDCNRAFHQAIGEACGNPVVAAFYNSLLGKTLRLAHLILNRRFPSIEPAHRYDVVIAEHDALVAAIAARDADLAERLAGEHADLFRRSVVRFFSQSHAAEVAIPNGPRGLEALIQKKSAE
ncbi:MAG: GntR family transcriptional regulator [Pseudomonadota bacterium]